MLLLGPYDPNTVYFQDSQEYIFHYDFATEWVNPFIDMNVPEFFDVTLYQSGQLGVLGAIILPPMAGNPPSPEFDEYGIQFVRYDPYSKEEIAAMFDVPEYGERAGRISARLLKTDSVDLACRILERNSLDD